MSVTGGAGSAGRAAAGNNPATVSAAANAKTALLRAAILRVRAEDVLHVILRLSIGWDIAVLLYGAGSCIICCHCQTHVAVEAVEQPFEVACAAGHVLRRIVRIAHAHRLRR